MPSTIAPLVMINAIPAQVWAARPDGSLEFFNRRWLDYTGLTLEGATGWGWVSVLHPDERDRLVDYWRSMASSGGAIEVEARVRRFDGEYRWFLCRGSPVFDEQGNLVRWYGTNTDIEDRKRVEGALRARKQSFQLIVDRIPALVCTMDTAGVLEFANRGIMEFFGRTFEELKNWASIGVVHPEDLPRVVAAWAHSVQTGTPYNTEHRMRRADGAFRWFNVRGLPARDPEGRIVRWYHLLVDIDEQKKAQDSLTKACADLARATRLTTMGELAATIAHEVNQPLAAVVTNAEACLRWLNRAPPNMDEVRGAIQRIIADGNRGREVITWVRALLKNERSVRSRVNVNEIIKETVLHADWRATTLVLELAQTLPLVSADRVQVQQVLLNLIMNALEAMKPVVERPHVVRIETKADAPGAVLVAIQDSGVGLRPAEIEQLFRAFYSTKPEGLGMGLSICRSIVESHGGRLWVECHARPGALFQFTLPVDDVGNA